MGLDSFKSDEEEEESNETTSSDKSTGLESFKSDSSDSNDKEEKDRPKSNPWMDDFTNREWNSMSVEDKVRYVRENYHPSYRPQVELGDGWNYTHVVEIECECDNIFTFRTEGVCMSCGRSYKKRNGAVVKKHDPHGDDDS